MRLELTRRSSYAIRAVMSLARITNGDVVTARRIAGEMRIPHRFLPQVMGDLVRAGFVEARVGRSGGYRLAVAPEELTILEVIEAVEGDARRRTCVLRGTECGSLDAPCDVHAVFAEAQAALFEALASRTIRDVLASPAQA